MTPEFAEGIDTSRQDQQPARDAALKVAGEALQGEQGDPKVWKPAGDGWLVQGEHNGQSWVVELDSQGKIRNARQGSFDTNVVSDLAGGRQALPEVLPSGTRVVDAENGILAVLMDGSEVRVKIGFSSELEEGRYAVGEARYQLTAEGLQQTEPVTIMLSPETRAASSTGRIDPAQRMGDLAAQLGPALNTVARGLPGVVVGDQTIQPGHARAAATPDARLGDLSGTTVPSSTDLDSSQDSEAEPRADGELVHGQFADVVAEIRDAVAADPAASGSEIVAVTGDPAAGPVLVRFADGSSVVVELVVDDTLPRGRVVVEHGQWVFDGQGHRQEGITTVRISDQIIGDDAAVRSEVADRVKAGLRQAHDGLPGTERHHTTANRVDLLRARLAAQEGEIPVTGEPNADARMPDDVGTGLIFDFGDGARVFAIPQTDAEPGKAAIELPELLEVDGRIWQSSPAVIHLPPDASVSTLEAVSARLGELVGQPGEISIDALRLLNDQHAGQLATTVDTAMLVPGGGNAYLLPDPLARPGGPASYLARLPGTAEFATEAQALLDALAKAGFQLTELEPAGPGLVVRGQDPSGRAFELRLLSPDGVIAHDAVAREVAQAGERPPDDVLQRRLHEYAGWRTHANLQEVQLPVRPDDPPSDGSPDGGPSDGGPSSDGPPAGDPPPGATPPGSAPSGNALPTPADQPSADPSSTGSREPDQDPTAVPDPPPPASDWEPISITVSAGGGDRVVEPAAIQQAISAQQGETERPAGATTPTAVAWISDDQIMVWYGDAHAAITVMPATDLAPGTVRVTPGRIEISAELPANQVWQGLVARTLVARALEAYGELVNRGAGVHVLDLDTLAAQALAEGAEPSEIPGRVAEAMRRARPEPELPGGWALNTLDPDSLPLATDVARALGQDVTLVVAGGRRLLAGYEITAQGEVTQLTPDPPASPRTPDPTAPDPVLGDLLTLADQVSTIVAATQGELEVKYQNATTEAGRAAVAEGQRAAERAQQLAQDVSTASEQLREARHQARALQAMTDQDGRQAALTRAQERLEQAYTRWRAAATELVEQARAAEQLVRDEPATPALPPAIPDPGADLLASAPASPDSDAGAADPNPPGGDLRPTVEAYLDQHGSRLAEDLGARSVEPVPGSWRNDRTGPAGMVEVTWQDGTTQRVWVVADGGQFGLRDSLSADGLPVIGLDLPGATDQRRLMTGARLVAGLDALAAQVSTGDRPGWTPDGARGRAQVLPNTDPFQGVDPTPGSIAHGTVRMEDHPDFPAVQQRLAELGFSIRPVTDHAAVQIRHIVDPDGNLLRVERELQYLEGMRFLDLEHELGHVKQLTERFPEGMPPHEVWVEHPDGRLTQGKSSPISMNEWQIRIAEYHVRLEEYIRLAERGVDAAVLAEHAEGLDLAYDDYRRATKKGRSPTRTGWAQERFPEIAALADRVDQLRSGQLDATPTSPDPDRPASPDGPGRGLPKLPAREPAVAAEELPGFAGHGGPQASAAVLDAVRDAAGQLAADHPGLPDAGYRLEFVPDPGGDPLRDVLIAEPTGSRGRAAAFQFTADEVATGRVAETTTEPVGYTDAGVPIYQVTVSETIPADARELVARRVVAHEVAHQLADRRSHGVGGRLRDAWGRLWPGGRMDAHELGMLAELRVELAYRPGEAAPARGASDQRIGHILDRLDAGTRMDQVVAQLGTYGGAAAVDLAALVQTAPDAGWRAEAAAQRRLAGGAAVASAAYRLHHQLGLVEHARLRTDGSGYGQILEVRAPSGELVELDVSSLLDRLVDSAAVGERLRAEAVAGLAAELAEAAGDQLGSVWGDGSELATARVLARLQDVRRPESAGEYQRALAARLPGLSSEQLAVLRGEPLPAQLLEQDLPYRIAEALLDETLSSLTGDGRAPLARSAQWRPDGRLVLAGRLRGRNVSAEVMADIGGWLEGRIAEGAELPAARADLAGVLGAELGRAGRAHRPRVVGALSALSQLSSVEAAGSETRFAAERLAGEILGGYSLHPDDWRALPQSARELVEQARAWHREDPLAALRPGHHEQFVQQLAADANALAAGVVTGSVPDVAGRAAELAETAQRLADELGQARTGLDERAVARQALQQAAQQEAAQQHNKVAEEAQHRDRRSAERARAAEVQAQRQEQIAARHERIADRFETARDQAGQLANQYQSLVQRLGDLSAHSGATTVDRAAQIADLAGLAQEAFADYRSAVAKTQPVLLDAGLSAQEYPLLNALTAKVNQLMAAQGVQTRVQPDELQRMLRTNWPNVVGPEGAVLSLALNSLDVRINFHPNEAVEIPNPVQRVAEIIHAQLPQFPMGSRIFGAAAHRTANAGYSLPLGRTVNAVGEAIPGEGPFATAMREGMRRFVFDYSRSGSRRWTVRGAGMPRFTVRGQVADNRGDSTVYNVDGHYEVQVRPAQRGATWTAAEQVDTAAEGDRASLELAVDHTYTEAAPTEVEQLPAPVDTRFPEHSVVRLDNLDDISGQVLELLGDAGEVTRQQVWTIVRVEFPARLDRAINNPNGFERTIYSGGHAVAMVRLNTEVELVPEPMVGPPSDQVHMEKLRVAFGGYNGGTEVGGARSHAVNTGFSALPQAEAAAGQLPNATIGPQYSGESSWREGISVGATAIRPNVQRHTGFTQTYRLRLKHTVSVHRFDTGTVRSAPPITGAGVFRLAELDAYRYGLPVDAAAIREYRDDGTVVRRDDGSAVLRDDLIPGAPPGRLAELPAYLGEHGIPGAGPALVRNLTGVDELRARVAEALRADGWLPDLVAVPGIPGKWPALSNDPMERSTQVANLLELEELTADRLEGAYDQAAQDGLVMEMTRHRPGRAPERTTLRIRVQQDWANAELLGHRIGDTDVSLDISSQTMSRQIGFAHPRAGGLSVSGTAGTDNELAVGSEEALTGDAGAGGGGRYTRDAGLSYGDTTNHVKLIEGQATGLTAVFRVPHRIEVVEIRPNGEEYELAGHTGGSAELGITADLLPEQAPRTRSSADPPFNAPTSREVIQRATVLHLDGTGLIEHAGNVLPGVVPGGAFDLGSPASDHVASFLDTRSLMAGPWWLYSEHRTDLAVDPRGLSSHRWSLAIRGEPGVSEFIGTADLVVVDGNLTMAANAVSFGQEAAGAGDGSVSGQLRGGGEEGEPIAGGSGSANTARSWGRSRTSTRIFGREGLTIEHAQLHYLYRMPVDIHLEGTTYRAALEGWGQRLEDTSDGHQVVYAVSERAALELYADGQLPVPEDQLTDALRRWANGKLHLDRRTVIGVLARMQETFGAAGMLPNQNQSFLPSRVLYARDGLAAALADKLESMLPAELAPPQGETRVGERVRAAVDLLAQVPDPTVGLPEHLHRSLGYGRLEAGAQLARLPDPAPQANQPDPSQPSTGGQPSQPALSQLEQVDLPQEVLRLIREVAPNAINDLPGLAQGWIGQLAADGWTGKLERMLGEGGYELDFSVRVGTGVENVTVTFSATLSEEGLLVGQTQTGLIGQDYAFAQHDLYESHGWSHGAGAAGNGAATGPATGNLGADIGYTGKAWASTQQTRIQRVSTFEGMLDRVQRDLRITIEVSRSGPEIEGWEQQARSVVGGPVVHLVPPGMVVPDGAGSAAPGQAAGRPSGQAPATPAELPPVYAPAGRMPQPFYVGTVEAAGLRPLVRSALSDPSVLGTEVTTEYETALKYQLNKLPMNVGLERMLGRAGSPMVNLPAPGKPGHLVQVFVKAELVGEPRVADGDRSGVGLGQDDRWQQVFGHEAGRDQRLPVTRGVSGDDPWLDTGTGGQVGSGQSSAQTELVRRGDRDERKIFQEGTAEIVEVGIRYTLTVVEKRIGWGSPERVLHEQVVEDTTRGEAFATIFASDHPALQQGVPDPAARLGSWLDPPEPGGRRTGPRRWFPRRAAAPPSITLDELVTAASQRPEYDPANPQHAVAAELAQRYTPTEGQPAPTIRLVTDGSNTSLQASGTDPLLLASQLAAARGGNVIVEIAEPDRPPRRYHARRDGQLTPQRPDGGFAAARSTLPPEMIRRANLRGVNLRELFDQAGGDTQAFAQAVRETLDPPAGGTATTALELPGAPGGRAEPDPVGTAAAIGQTMSQLADRFDQLTIHEDGTAVGVPRGADYALRFEPGPAREGLRGYREPTGETTPDGKPIIQVTVVDSIPVGDRLAPGLNQRDLWVRRVLVHEIAEAAAVARDGTVDRVHERLRGRLPDQAHHPDALVPGADPGLPTLSAHDLAHRAEVIDLVQLRAALYESGALVAAEEVERQLGLLLDGIGVGVAHPDAPDAVHTASRLALLALPPEINAVVETLRGPDAEWRASLAEPLHPLPRVPDSYHQRSIPLSQTELAGARLAMRDGVLYDADGRRFDSRRLAPDRQVLYVMDTRGDLYVVAPGEYTHASFPVPVAGAGTIVVLDGIPAYLDGESQQYAPPPEYVRQVAGALERAGADLAGRVVYPAAGPVAESGGVAIDRFAADALAAAVDRLAAALDATGRHPRLAGIEQLPGGQVRLRLRGQPSVEVDLAPLVVALADRGVTGEPLVDAATGWLDTVLRDEVATRLAASPAAAPEPAPAALPDAVGRVAGKLAAEWSVTADGAHVAVVRPPRGRPITFRVVPDPTAGESVVLPRTSTRPELREAEQAGEPAVEVTVPAALLADRGKLDRLVGRALQAHAAELAHARTGLAGLAARVLWGRPGPDALGPEGTGRELTVRDEQQVAQLRLLLDEYRQAAPGQQAVIAREVLELAGGMFKRHGDFGRVLQHQLIADRLPEVDDVADLLREIGRRAAPPARASDRRLVRLALELGQHDPTAPPAAGSPRPPVEVAPPPVQLPPVQVSDDRRRWIAEIPPALADRAGERDSFAIDALVEHVEGLLRAAADPAAWSQGRPPRVELTAPAGIDASVARRLEHVRVEFEARDAAGRPVPAPRAVVVGPRRHGHPAPLPIHPGALAEDLQDGRTLFDEPTRARFEVQWRDGLAYDRAGNPLDGPHIYVVEPETHKLYAISYHEQEQLNAKHSALLATGDVAAAGEFLAEHGRLRWLDNHSGHYLPVADHAWLARELLAANQVDTAALDVVVHGAHPTRQSAVRGARMFAAALAELRQPGEIDGVLRIERVDGSPIARRDGRGVPGAVLRVFTANDRWFDIDVSNVANYLLTVRPAGEDGAHFLPGYRSFASDRELVWQASDWLRQRIETALSAPAEATDPALPTAYAGQLERWPRTLSDLDSLLAAMVGEPRLASGGEQDAGSTWLGGSAAATAATTLRAVSEQRIDAEVDAAWLPADAAAALKAALKERLTAAVARYPAGHTVEAQQVLVQAAADAGLRPDLPAREVYDRLQRVSRPVQLTVSEAAQLLDAAHGGHAYERSLAGWLATPAGRAHHDTQLSLDLAVQSPRPLRADSSRFVSLGEAEAAQIHAGQGGDWPAPVRASMEQYVRGEYAIEAYIGSYGARAHGGRADALQVQAGMRPSGADALLHARVPLHELGAADAASLARLIGQTVSGKSFVRASIGTAPRSDYGELRLEIEAPAGTRMAWLGAVGHETGDTDVLLAAGTRFQILRMTRGEDGTYTMRVRVVGQSDPLAFSAPAPAGEIAATVVAGTGLAEEVAAQARGDRAAPERQRQIGTLWNLLDQRWSGEVGQPARGDAFVRGIEPGRFVTNPETGEVELSTVVHPRRGRGVPATIRFGPLGGDAEGRQRRAMTELVTDPASGKPKLQITISDQHPADADLLVTLSHEVAEALAFQRRQRQAGALSGQVPETGHADRLVPGAAPERGASLSPHDLGGVADLMTKLLQLVATTDPAARTRLVTDIEAIRVHLGLDPSRDGADAATRWRMVDAEVRQRHLPPAARRQLAALRRPGWRDQLVALEVASSLAEQRPESLPGRIRKVSVADDGSLVVSTRRVPGASVRVRVEGADLPAGVPFETARVGREMVVRVPQAALADPARAAGVVAPAVAAGVAEAAAVRRHRLRGWLRRSSANLLPELSPDAVTGDRPRLGAHAQGQWAAVTVAARRVVVLSDQLARASDPVVRDQLRRQRDQEREWLQATLAAWGLLEGQDGFVWRRLAVERTRGAVPSDPRVAEQVRPMVRLGPDPDAVLASLDELVPLVAQAAGARGAQVVEGQQAVRVILDDKSVHQLEVSMDLPADHPRFVQLQQEQGGGWRLRVRPDASRVAVGIDVAGALAEAVARLSGRTDPAVVAAESTAGRLRFLHAWNRVAGPLEQPVIEAHAQALVDELTGTGQPGQVAGSDSAAEVATGGQQFADRVAGRRRRMGKAERHQVAAPVPASDVPPRWMYFPGRAAGSAVSSTTSIVNGLEAERDAALLYAQTASTAMNSLLQAQQDGALRRALYADRQRAGHRDAEAATAAPAASGSPDPDAGSGAASTGPPVVPPQKAWPFYRKRALPTLVASGGLGLFMWVVGERGPTGMTGALGPLAHGTTYGAADHLAERPEQQARADRKHAVEQLADGQRNAALDTAYHVAAELHTRVAELAEAGQLDAATTGDQRAELIDRLRQTQAVIDAALAGMSAQEQQSRAEIARRRRARRLLLEAAVLGPGRLGWMALKAPAQLAWAGVRVPVRAIGSRLGITPAAPSGGNGSSASEAGLPAGMAPASHYVARMTAPGLVSAVSYSAVTLLLDPGSFNFVALTGLATLGAGIGLGRGWATLRADEVSDELSLAAVRAANDARDASYHIEQTLARLGDPDADPDGRLPADRSAQPADSYFLAVALIKHGPALTLRVVAIGAAGPVLLPGETALLLLTVGSQAVNQAFYGIGEAIFRKLTAGVNRRFRELTAQQQAQQLALTPLELAEVIHTAAEQANQAGGQGGTSTTAVALPGAPGGQGPRDPVGTAAAIGRALSELADRFDGPPVRSGRGVLVVPRGAGYALRFEPGSAREGLRGYRKWTGETTSDGKPIIQVTVVDSIPEGTRLAPDLTQRELWVRRVVVHETAEAAALARGGPVERVRERMRHPEAGPGDALARGADPSLTTLSAHDEAHRAEVIDLAELLVELSEAGELVAAREVERQLGLLLDELGVGVAEPNAPDARHASGRLAVLGLPPAIAEVVEPLRGPDAGWRARLAEPLHPQPREREQAERAQAEREAEGQREQEAAAERERQRQEQERREAVERARRRNPEVITGGGPRWWEQVVEDTDRPIPVRDLEVGTRSSTYTIARGQAVRRNGITYLVEDGARPGFDLVVDDLEQIHRTLPGGDEHQQAYLWLAGRNPADAAWAKKYGRPGLRSFATAGDGSVQIWDRRDQLGSPSPRHFAESLRHEFGHNVSMSARSRGLHAHGQAWADAVAADRGSANRVHAFRGITKSIRSQKISWQPRTGRPFPDGVTEYGSSAVLEDYAESVALYLTGEIGSGVLPGSSSRVPIYFRDIFPARTAILDQLFPDVARQQLAATARRGR